MLWRETVRIRNFSSPHPLRHQRPSHPRPLLSFSVFVLHQVRVVNVVSFAILRVTRNVHRLCKRDLVVAHKTVAIQLHHRKPNNAFRHQLEQQV